MIKCQKCGYEWLQRKQARPKRCPKCNEKNYDTFLNPIEPYKNQCVCLRCGKIWISRGDKKPKVCPRCHSTRWDKTEEWNRYDLSDLKKKYDTMKFPFKPLPIKNKYMMDVINNAARKAGIKIHKQGIGKYLIITRIN